MKQSIILIQVGFALAAISFLSSAKSDITAQTLKSMEDLKMQYRLPSLSVAIGQGSRILFARAIGVSNVEANRAANPETQYSVGSLAKPMTGIAVAKLVDSGKIELGSAVSTYIDSPDYTSSFTVRQLASHIAGIPHDTPEREVAEFQETKNHKSPFDAFYVFEAHPLLFKPGTQYQYSSNGYIMLSAVIERAAGLGYVDFLRQSLWSTFNMNLTELDTSFAGKDLEATYYSEAYTDGTYAKSFEVRDRSFLFGGGGFISTPTDLVKMSQATYDARYLSDVTRQLFYTPTKLLNGEVNSDKYSLGWRVGEITLSSGDERPWTALHHGGVTDEAATAFLLVVPECQASIAFATNYVPEKFWRMRGAMAAILKGFINREHCSAVD